MNKASHSINDAEPNGSIDYSVNDIARVDERGKEADASGDTASLLGEFFLSRRINRRIVPLEVVALVRGWGWEVGHGH